MCSSGFLRVRVRGEVAVKGETGLATGGTISTTPPSRTITPPSSSTRAARSGPARIAVFATISACSPVGATAVTCSTPVSAGRPVRGSMRWWPSRQRRRVTPLVATAARPTWKACSTTPLARSNGSRAWIVRVRSLRAADAQVAAAVDDPRVQARPAPRPSGRRPGPCRARRCPGARRPGARPSRPRTRTARHACAPHAGAGGGPAANSRAGIPVPPVARGLDRGQARRVDEPARLLAGRRHRGGEPPHERARRDALARVGVQATQLAVGIEAAQPALHLKRDVAGTGHRHEQAGLPPLGADVTVEPKQANASMRPALTR